MFVPGLIFTVWFFFSPFILAREKISALGALVKSREQVRGKFFPLALRLLAVWLICLLISAIPVIGQILAIVILPLGIFHAHLLSRNLEALSPNVVVSTKGKTAMLPFDGAAVSLAGTFVPRLARA